MANRKVTVLNPAGYQEQLQSGDVAAFDSNDIKLGTDKITLVASNGSATFAGDLQINDIYSDTSGTGAYLSAGGKINLRVADTSSCFNIYGNGSSDRSVFIKGDGSATFGGTVTTGGLSHTGSGVSTINTSTTNPTIYARNVSNGSVFSGFSAGSPSNPTSSINANGSATFAGGVTFNQWIDCGAQGTFKGAGGSDNNRAVEVKNQSGGVTAGIKGDGSAEFGGKIVAGINGASEIRIAPNTTNAFGVINTSGVEKVSLNYDGSATFAGPVNGTSATFSGTLEAASIDGGTY